MQQTKSYWRVVLVAGVVSAFLGAACTVTTSTDGGAAGDAGDGNTAGAPSAGSSGSGTAGSGTAGKAGSSGAGASGAAGAGGAGPTPFQCDPGQAGATGTPDMNACEMTMDQTDCDKCVRTKCCTEYANCYATDPGNQCGYGGPNNDGEFFCYQSCLVDVFTKNQSIDSTDAGTCAAKCGTSKDLKGSQDCGSVLGTATNDLIACVMDQGCNVACYGG